MQLQRTELVEALSGAIAAGAVLVEAPAGYGKSWLIRKLVDRSGVRVRGQFGQNDEIVARSTDAQLVIEDAHLLSPDDCGRLADHIEDAPDGTRILLSGRLLPRELHEIVQLVNGRVFDETALAVSPSELLADNADLDCELAEQVVEAAGGCVRTIRGAFEKAEATPGSNPATVATGITKDAAAAVVQSLGRADRDAVGVLARVADIDEHLLLRFAGTGVLDRMVAAGVPLRRDAAGRLDIAAAYVYRSTPVGADVAADVAAELVARDRTLEALSLLVDAGRPSAAADLLRLHGDSLVDIAEPRQMLKLLAGLGRLVDDDPELLLVRAGSFAMIGRFSDTIADIDRAAELAEDADPQLQRRVRVESARVRLAEGRIDLAVPAARQALVDLGPDEQRTYARAHEILAECAATSENRAELQRAAEEFHTAAAGWEACGERARARACRTSLAIGVLVSLGRIDESLAQLNQLLAAPDVTPAERAWTVLGEGFVLANGGRLDHAEDRFRQIAELGVLQDNPRLIAAAAWGRALVATCRDDLQHTLQWIATAENTALDTDADLLGVQFLVDASLMVGALGELDLAERYLARAVEWPSAFPAQTTLARFVLDARTGTVGDVDAQLEATAPSQWWRILLVSALAVARDGDLDRARPLASEAYRELMALGFEDAALLGERRAQEELQALLDESTAEAPVLETVAAPVTSTGRRLRVIGPTMMVTVDGAMTPIPTGNPERLVGVTVSRGGSATFDQLSEAIWPGDDVEASRTRLRNVILRMRKVVGDVVLRTGNGVRLAPDVSCDLDEFHRLASDAASVMRADPDLAGQLAERALAVGSGTVFAEFEYEEWATMARHDMEAKLIELLDLLSIRAEDAGDLSTANLYAERALRLDRYSDSRYRRRSELFALQGRNAQAAAVLEEGAAVLRELEELEDEDPLTRSEVPTRRTQRRT